MAYMNQEMKSNIAVGVKKVLAKYGMKGSLSVRNNMVLVLTIKSGPIDAIKNFNDVMKKRMMPWDKVDYAKTNLQVNEYHYSTQYSGVTLAFLDELIPAMNFGNHDNSDIQSDYFDVGWYTDIQFGTWNKPYVLTE